MNDCKSWYISCSEEQPVSNFQCGCSDIYQSPSKHHEQAEHYALMKGAAEAFRDAEDPCFLHVCMYVCLHELKWLLRLIVFHCWLMWRFARWAKWECVQISPGMLHWFELKHTVHSLYVWFPESLWNDKVNIRYKLSISTQRSNLERYEIHSRMTNRLPSLMFFVFLLFNEQIIHIRAECTAASSSCCWFVQSLHYSSSVTDWRWQSQMGEQILKTVLDQ